MTAIHILILTKSAAGDARPISVPAVWRKLAATRIVTHHRGHTVAQFLGSRQYGIRVPSGTAAFAKRIAELAEASPTHLFIQSSNANAFGSVHRATIQEALTECDHSLSSRLALSRSHGLYTMPNNERQHITDPLSVMAFASPWKWHSGA
eukprot:657961-Amphidinium_carterae.4